MCRDPYVIGEVECDKAKLAFIFLAQNSENSRKLKLMQSVQVSTETK